MGLAYIGWLGSKDRARRGIPLKRWALFAAAPLITVTLQFLQNWWYLGWDDLVLDIKGVLLYRMGDSSQSGKFWLRGKELLNTFQMMTGLWYYYAIPALALLVAACVYLRKRIFGSLPGLNIFVLFLVAGSAFALVFAQSSDLKCQGRQLAPAISLIFATVFFIVIKIASGPRVLFNRKPALSVSFFIILVLSLSVISYGQLKRTIGYVADWPNNAINAESMQIYKALGRMSEDDLVIALISRDYAYANPQPMPRWEYYSGRTILTFKSPELFLKDLQILKRRAERPFDVVILTPDEDVIPLLMPILGGRARSFDSGHYMLFVKDPVVPEGIFSRE